MIHASFICILSPNYTTSHILKLFQTSVSIIFSHKLIMIKRFLELPENYSMKEKNLDLYFRNVNGQLISTDEMLVL